VAREVNGCKECCRRVFLIVWIGVFEEQLQKLKIRGLVEVVIPLQPLVPWKAFTKLLMGNLSPSLSNN